ncbi:hypothetical protein NEOKW01_1377 [Nematocida sp. AWRm80]|nr:hypothetical protein NEOKW01_1377 [Nematocida sp. AWRm80]
MRKSTKNPPTFRTVLVQILQCLTKDLCRAPIPTPSEYSYKWIEHLVIQLDTVAKKLECLSQVAQKLSLWHETQLLECPSPETAILFVHTLFWLYNTQYNPEVIEDTPITTAVYVELQYHTVTFITERCNTEDIHRILTILIEKNSLRIVLKWNEYFYLTSQSMQWIEDKLASSLLPIEEESEALAKYLKEKQAEELLDSLFK